MPIEYRQKVNVRATRSINSPGNASRFQPPPPPPPVLRSSLYFIYRTRGNVFRRQSHFKDGRVDRTSGDLQKKRINNNLFLYNIQDFVYSLKTRHISVDRQSTYGFNNWLGVFF